MVGGAGLEDTGNRGRGFEQAWDGGWPSGEGLEGDRVEAGTGWAGVMVKPELGPWGWGGREPPNLWPLLSQQDDTLLCWSLLPCGWRFSDVS